VHYQLLEVDTNVDALQDFSFDSTLPNSMSIALSVGMAALLRRPDSLPSIYGKGFYGQVVQVGAVSGGYALIL
jgi:hypothetical protein